MSNETMTINELIRIGNYEYEGDDKLILHRLGTHSEVVGL